MTETVSRGHELFRLLQQGKYFRASREGVRFDYWNDLPEERQQQYERAANSLMMRGAELERSGKLFDPAAITIAPPPMSGALPVRAPFSGGEVDAIRRRR